tara:strand:+ start:144 stop:356 length:213 start_codon:yes stop_codon:yes gene_type:complete
LKALGTPAMQLPLPEGRRFQVIALLGCPSVAQGVVSVCGYSAQGAAGGWEPDRLFHWHAEQTNEGLRKLD